MWACVNLKNLAVQFELPQRVEDARDEKTTVDSRVIPRTLFRQMSQLSKLEELRLGKVTVRSEMLSRNISSPFTDITLAYESEMWRPKDEAAFSIKWLCTVSDSMVVLLTALSRLMRLELRNMMAFVDAKGEMALARAERRWHNIEWVQYS